MNGLDWWPYLLSFVGGSLVGTIVKIFWDHRREKKQPVTYAVDVTPLLEEPIGQLRLSLDVAGAHYQYDNMYQVEVFIQNTGHKDFASFRFGVTLLAGHTIIAQSVEADDRHHVAAPALAPSPSAPSSTIDYVLAPFNRRDKYALRLSVTLADNETTLVPIDVQVTTAEPVQLKRALDRSVERFSKIMANGLGRALLRGMLGPLS